MYGLLFQQSVWDLCDSRVTAQKYEKSYMNCELFDMINLVHFLCFVENFAYAFLL